MSEEFTPNVLTSEQVFEAQFPITKFRDGYDQDQIDDYLDQVVRVLAYYEALAAQPQAEVDLGYLTVRGSHVREVDFDYTRMREGYDQDAVDDFLDQVAASLEVYENVYGIPPSEERYAVLEVDSDALEAQASARGGAGEAPAGPAAAAPAQADSQNLISVGAVGASVPLDGGPTDGGQETGTSLEQNYDTAGGAGVAPGYEQGYEQAAYGQSYDSYQNGYGTEYGGQYEQAGYAAGYIPGTEPSYEGQRYDGQTYEGYEQGYEQGYVDQYGNPQYFNGQYPPGQFPPGAYGEYQTGYGPGYDQAGYPPGYQYEGQYPGQYDQGAYGSGYVQGYEGYDQGSYQNGEYAQAEYTQEQYAGGQFVPGAYPGGEYPDGYNQNYPAQYAQGDYASEQNAGPDHDQYSQGQETQEEYAPDEYAQAQYAADEADQGQSEQAGYDTDPYIAPAAPQPPAEAIVSPTRPDDFSAPGALSQNPSGVNAGPGDDTGAPRRTENVASLPPIAVVAAPENPTKAYEGQYEGQYYDQTANYVTPPATVASEHSGPVQEAPVGAEAAPIVAAPVGEEDVPTGGLPLQRVTKATGPVRPVQPSPDATSATSGVTSGVGKRSATHLVSTPPLPTPGTGIGITPGQKPASNGAAVAPAANESSNTGSVFMQPADPPAVPVVLTGEVPVLPPQAAPANTDKTDNADMGVPFTAGGLAAVPLETQPGGGSLYAQAPKAQAAQAAAEQLSAPSFDAAPAEASIGAASEDNGHSQASAEQLSALSEVTAPGRPLFQGEHNPPTGELQLVQEPTASDDGRFVPHFLAGYRSTLDTFTSPYGQQAGQNSQQRPQDSGSQAHSTKPVSRAVGAGVPEAALRRKSISTSYLLTVITSRPLGADDSVFVRLPDGTEVPVTGASSDFNGVHLTLPFN